MVDPIVLQITWGGILVPVSRIKIMIDKVGDVGINQIDHSPEIPSLQRNRETFYDTPTP